MSMFKVPTLSPSVGSPSSTSLSAFKNPSFQQAMRDLTQPQLGIPVRDDTKWATKIVTSGLSHRVRPTDPPVYDTPIEAPGVNEPTNLPSLDSFTEFLARAKNHFFGSDFESIEFDGKPGKRIPATEGADVIEVRFDANTGGTFVTINGDTSYLSAEEAQFLVIDGLQQNDTLRVDSAVPFPVIQNV